MFKTRTKNKALAMLLVLAMVIAFVPVAAHANYTPSEIGNTNVIAGFGDPNADPTEPECYMSLVVDENNSSVYNAVYSNSQMSGFFPEVMALYAAPKTGFTGTLTLVAQSSAVWFETYDQYGEATSHSSITYDTNENWNTTSNSLQKSYLFVTKHDGAGTIAVTDGTTTLFYIYLQAPQSYNATGVTTTPNGFLGYLPVGQFATGTGWGSPFSNGAATQGLGVGTPKVVGGYSATGLSLGAGGGYAEYSMTIKNFESVNGQDVKIKRPYGVDFVVYGNAFNQNPEAGSVKVYGTRKDTGAWGWFELAGSLYYSDVTLRDVTVTYKKVTSTDNTFTSNGIWYKITKGSSTITDWTKFNTNTSVAWWPEPSEGYFDYNNKIGVWGAVPNVTYDSTNNTIAYEHVTLVRDTDTNDDYRFGYFDVTINPTSSSSYGIAINPYAAYDKDIKGGDGYDLDWAVDENGNPVELDYITKIQVYTSAAMKTDGSNEFTVPAVFGETSAELCGIYACTGTTTDITGTVGFSLVLKATDNSTQAISISPSNMGTVVKNLNNLAATYGNLNGKTYTSYTLTVTPGYSSSVVYINDDSYTGTQSVNNPLPTGTDMIRVIVQHDAAAPYICLFKFS